MPLLRSTWLNSTITDLEVTHSCNEMHKTADCGAAVSFSGVHTRSLVDLRFYAPGHPEFFLLPLEKSRICDTYSTPSRSDSPKAAINSAAGTIRPCFHQQALTICAPGYSAFAQLPLNRATTLRLTVLKFVAVVPTQSRWIWWNWNTNTLEWYTSPRSLPIQLLSPFLLQRIVFYIHTFERCNNGSREIKS